jgi:predicted 3-demethylubiquinone-9 3-methyltransferase (glyoxalase superfamily)
MPKITPFLWFENNAQEAAEFYTSIFKNSKIDKAMVPPEGTPNPPADVLVVNFKLDGVQFTALNGGPYVKFNESISFVVHCDDQAEVDHYWEKLIEGGGEPSQCGWLKDKFGVSWQITPRILLELMNDPDPEKSARVMEAMLKMSKIDIEIIKNAYDGD